MSRSNLSPIEESVAKQLQQNFSDRETVSLVIGVSGGADSMCLLHVLHRLGVVLHVVHVNYQKRGAESDKDQTLVEDRAEALNIDCKVVAVEPHEAEGENFQQWAREVRYNAFEIREEQTCADGIATAHQEDDQIETILQKIFRGGALASWQAIKTWDGHLFRPLLAINREQIEAYCREHEVPYREDASNFKNRFARNFLRNEWLPRLEKHFPGWRTNVLRITEQARIFATSLHYILKDISDGKNRLHRQKFLQLDAGLQKSLLLYYVHRVDESAEISRDTLKEVSKLGGLQTGKSIQLTENLELMRDREYLKLVVNEGQVDVFLTLKKEELTDQNIIFNDLELSVQPFKNPDFERDLYLDAASFSWPLQLRRWKAGDRFRPFGMEGHQSVADHLTNRKVSAAAKEKALVLESFEETICAVIFPPIENRVPPGTISEKVRCDSSTRTCLTIKQIL